MRITIGVPTRSRPRALSRLLASLHAQTYKDWDLMIIDDSMGDMLDVAGQMMLDAIESNGHKAWVQKGVRINQAYSHNAVLWSDQPNKYIMRVDDDMILFPDYLKILVQKWTELEKEHRVGAVSGTIFTDHVSPRDEHTPVPTYLHDSVEVGSDGGRLCAPTFMQEYTDGTPIQTQHLYSSCLYDRDAMRRAGGFPLVYSRGVSYHEETDASYRLHLSGHALFLCPGAKATHSHEGIGGTRLMPPAEHARRRALDWETFLLRLGKLRGIPSFQPSVCLCSQHCTGVGGGQRLTYSLFNSLLELKRDGWLGHVSLMPLGNEIVQTPEEIEENFGLSGVKTAKCADLEHFDVVISLGHTVPKPGELPPRRNHVHYSLYPLSEAELPKHVDRMVAISSFSSEGARRIYHRNAEIIYPYVENAKVALDEKHNRIVTIGRTGSNKSLDTLTSAFLKMDLPLDTELHIVVPEEDFDQDALEIKRMSQNERVVLHTGLTQDELSSLYASSAILWAAKGYGRPLELPEFNFEHFGYTPIEALMHHCLPIAFDAGGYQETVTHRWETLDELAVATKNALENKEDWANALARNIDEAWPFTKEHFKREWLRVIMQMNAYTWEQSVEWRTGDTGTTGAIGSDIHVAVIGDHPELPTGYGIICKQITKGIIAAGMKPHVLGINGSAPSLSGEYEIWPSPHGVEANRAVMPSFLSSREFGAAVVMYDPFVSSRLINSIRANAGYLPIVSFVSQEGRPAHAAWENILAKSRGVVTYSKSAANAIELAHGHEKKVGWVHLGVDHAPFERYDKRTRDALRSMLGWDDLFVIYTVSANKRNKAIWKQMQTAMILQSDYGHGDVKLVLHTSPKPDLRFHGIDVEMYASQIRINPRSSMQRGVIIAPTPKEGYAPYECDLSELFRQGVPGNIGDTHAWYVKLGMIARYNLADLYLDMSSCEGFGLPIFEAMACGVPAITINDNFVRREVIGDHPALLPAQPLDVWNTGAEMMLASPVDAAARIDAFRYGDENAAIMGESAKKIVEPLRWKNAQDKVVEAIRKCLT